MKSYRIRIEDHTYGVTVGELDHNPIQVTVDGEIIEIWLEEESPLTVNGPSGTQFPASGKMPSEFTAAQRTAPVNSTDPKKVKAPIPGVITSVAVKAGEHVTMGQVLCNLEAMKMNNGIRANRAGTIAVVHVETGQHVKHHEVLMEYTD